MTNDTLEVLFGSVPKTRVLRFFVLNPDGEFDAQQLREKTMISVKDLRREMPKLRRIGFITEKSRRGVKIYCLNQRFSYISELRELFQRGANFPQCRSVSKIKGIGTVRYAATSGIFVNYPKSKVDLLLVAENVSRARLANVIKLLEAEVGHEVRYVLITTDELKYRLDMLDRFLVEFFECPHEEIINRLPLPLRTATNRRKK